MSDRPEIVTYDYRIAPGGEGPHATTWADKPHRLIYDLCSEIDYLRKTIELMKEQHAANS